MFLLDTNIYIEVFTRGADDSAFRAFHRAALPQLVLSSVVVHELFAGARGTAQRQQLERLVVVFSTRRRVHVPALSTWRLAATFDHDLRRLGGYVGSLTQRSFANDLLLAATARELGATIITRNLSDFELISRVAPIKALAPWPSVN